MPFSRLQREQQVIAGFFSLSLARNYSNIVEWASARNRDLAGGKTLASSLRNKPV